MAGTFPDMLQFVISAVRENNRGSVDRLSNWTLPISGEIGGSFPDTEGDTWFYATLDTPLGYTMPSGMGVGNGSSPTPVTDVVLRPFYLDENPSPGMQAFLMDFAVVLDPGMRESGVIDVNLVDFIAVVEVDDAAVHGNVPAGPAPDVEPAREEAPPVEEVQPEPEPELATFEDVTFPAHDGPEPEPAVFSAAGEMQPDPRDPVTIPQVNLTELSPEMAPSEFVPEETSPDELPPVIPQAELPATVAQVEIPPATPQAGPPTFIPQFELPPATQLEELPPAIPQEELPPAMSQEELPHTIPQADPPTFIPQFEIPPTMSQEEPAPAIPQTTPPEFTPQVELPPTVPQADLSDFVPTPKPPPTPRRAITRPTPVREEVVFDDVAERTPRNTGPLKLAAAAAAVLVLGGLGFSALFSSSGDAEAPAAQIESTTDTTTAAMSTPTPPAPLPLSPEELARVVRELPTGYTPELCPPREGVESGGVGTLACGPNPDPGGPLSGLYTVFRDRTSLNEAFDRAVYASTQQVCPENMQSPGPWRRNAAPELEAGVLFCGTRGETPVVIWSDIEKLRLSTVLGRPEGPNLDAMYGWWTQHS